MLTGRNTEHPLPRDLSYPISYSGISHAVGIEFVRTVRIVNSMLGTEPGAAAQHTSWHELRATYAMTRIIPVSHDGDKSFHLSRASVLYSMPQVA